MEASLRERKKTATRQALHEAVLRLALAHGLDSVTVEAVADEANVSRRTFSNYFSSKEDALLYGERLRIEQLLAALRGRPATETPWRALTSAARSQYEGDNIDPNRLAQLRLVLSDPSLLARQVAVQAALERDLAVEIAARSAPAADEPMRSRVMAGVFLATLRSVVSLWVEERAPRSLATAITAGLDRAAERFR